MAVNRGPWRTTSGLGLALILSMTSCAATNRGGPELSFDVKAELKLLDDKYKQSSAVAKYLNDASYQTREKRNEFIMGRLTAMNIRFGQFVQEFGAEKRKLDTVADVSVLFLSLTGAATVAASTKTVLASAAAGIAGTKQVIDKTYYFEKTTPALIAAMNAQRKKVLVAILKGMGQSLGDYSFPQAMTDLYTYYQAGTIDGAVQAIQADAGEKERDQDRKIASVVQGVKEEQILEAAEFSLAIYALKHGHSENSVSDAEVLRIYGVVKDSYRPPLDPATDAADALSKLRTRLQESINVPGEPALLGAALKTAGLKPVGKEEVLAAINKLVENEANIAKIKAALVANQVTSTGSFAELKTRLLELIRGSENAASLTPRAQRVFEEGILPER